MIHLRKWQEAALTETHNAWRSKRRPVIHAVMGAGKSYVIAELARQAFRYGYHVTVTTPTQALVEQLYETYTRATGQMAGRFYADVKEVRPVTFVCQPSLEAYEQARARKLRDDETVMRLSTDGKVYEPDIPKRIWIADEAHKTECDTVHAWVESVTLHQRVGLTATPWRADESESIQLFDEVVYRYTARDAYEDGHVVKPSVHHVDGEGEPDDLVVPWIQEQLELGGGVCNATSISDAEDFAYRLTSAGINTIAVHSEQPNMTAADAVRHIEDGGVAVYVDMLSEGFDCPAIRWMVMRRPVKSRVRFAQEVGRGLRADEGKETCHVLDVYDLFNVHSLDWKACLGEVDQAEIVPALKLVDFLESGGHAPSSWLEKRMPAECLRPVRSFLRATRVEMQFEGRIPERIESTHWRSDPVSRKQWSFLHGLMHEKAASVPEEWRPALGAAYYGMRDAVTRAPNELTGALRKGDAADMISILKGL